MTIGTAELSFIDALEAVDVELSLEGRHAPRGKEERHDVCFKETRLVNQEGSAVVHKRDDILSPFFFALLQHEVNFLGERLLASMDIVKTKHMIDLTIARGSDRTRATTGRRDLACG